MFLFRRIKHEMGRKVSKHEQQFGVGTLNVNANKN